MVQFYFYCYTVEFVLAVFLIIVIVPSAALTPMIGEHDTQLANFFYTLIFTALGALQCPPFLFIGSLTTALIGTVLIIGALCLVFQCCKGEDSSGYRIAIYFCNCCTFLAMLGLIGASTYFIFVEPPSYESARRNHNCTRFLEVPVATVISSYVFLALICLSTMVCYWHVCKNGRENSPA